MLLTETDKERFERAVRDAGERQPEGIGMLGEKILHASLKNYFSGENDLQEQKVGRYVADILGEDGIVEVQTGGFWPLKKKLEVFLAEYPVTVVCPIMRRKTLFWIDPVSGTVEKGGKSPKKGRPSDILPELFYLSGYLKKDGFRVLLVFYDGEEYRVRDGWSKDGKHGAHRAERVPRELVGTMLIESEYDCGALLPQDCPERFSAPAFEKMTGLRGKRLWAALTLLQECGVIRKDKNGRAVLYIVERKEFLCHD